MAGLISNGTYVLGDPNTRDLYLGKGLKDGFEGDKYYIAVDETVLWEGTLNSVNNVATLSETLENFETVKFYCCDPNNNCTNIIEACRTKNNNFAVSNFNISVEFVLNGNGNFYKRHTCLVPNTERTTLTATKGYALVFTAAKATNYEPISSGSLGCILTKVVGINRKRG